MSIKQLMQPRYKVMIDFPCIGDKPYVGLIIGREFFLNNDYVLPFYADNYPNLFKKIEWWEDRKAEDMPAYLKHMIDGSISCIMEQGKYTPSDVYLKCKEGFYHGTLYDNLPATEEEYLKSLLP